MKVVIEEYSEKEYKKVENKYIETVQTFKKIPDFKAEIVKDFNKYNFYQIDLDEKYKEYDNVLDFTKQNYELVVYNFFTDMGISSEERQSLDITDRELLRTAVNFRLTMYYEARIAEQFKLMTLLKLAKENNQKIQIYSAKTLDNLGIDFIIYFKKLNNEIGNFSFIHSINGSKNSWEKLEDKLKKVQEIELNNGKSVFYDRKKEYNLMNHVFFADFASAKQRNFAETRINSIKNKAEDILDAKKIIQLDSEKGLHEFCKMYEVAKNNSNEENEMKITTSFKPKIIGEVQNV